MPEEDIVAYDNLVIDVRPSDEPLLLYISSPEVTFKGFGSASSGDLDNIELVLLSSSPTPLHQLLNICPTRSWNWIVQSMLNLIVINVDFGKFLKVISNVTILFQKKFTDTIDNNYFFCYQQVYLQINN